MLSLKEYIYYNEEASYNNLFKYKRAKKTILIIK